VKNVAAKEAKKLYETLSDYYADSKTAKVAAKFDEEYLSITDVPTLSKYYDLYMPSTTSKNTLEQNLLTLGVVDKSFPKLINIYANSFENKDEIANIITRYNESVEKEEDEIKYVDYVALLMSGITDIINAISIGLITFVSISLVVSSIMIGIITYISVLERTKEIGILRAIGASKRDISRVFNAETMIVGLTAGILGIGISTLLCIPINFIIHTLTGITTINAYLEPLHSLILVLISMILTLIAGIIPSRLAAKKDPVEALRVD